MSVPLRLLLVEDSPSDAKLVLHELKRAGYEVMHERVDEREALRAALGRGPWDLVISDWSMPRFSALETLAVVKESKLDLPVIIVSGTIGEELAVDMMRAGAHDYVLKDKLTRLPVVVKRELEEVAQRRARRAAEDALRRSEARFARLSESGLIGILVSDSAGLITEANDTFLRLIAASREDLSAGELNWLKLTPPELVEQHHEPLMRQLLETGMAAPWETETIRMDGSRVPILVGIAALDPPNAIAFVVDVSERKKAEQERIRSEKALRQMEEQLRQAQKMEAVGRLAGGVAHDFNNVLSVILSYSEFILGDLPSTDPIREDIEEVRKAGLRAADLTRQLLMFSRQHVIEPQVLDVNTLLHDMNKMLRRIMREDVDYAFLPGADIGRVWADRGSLEQVIMNLVVNARDAMPEGGKVTVETENVVVDAEYASQHLAAKEGPAVMIAVTDTGIGMDKETMRRIFEPFFTTKDVGKGTGLGLSTAFGIIQQSGGHLWVYSEVGRGTTFKIYLPRIDQVAVATRSELRDAADSWRGTETILLVEDEEQVRVVAREILTRSGYTVLEARGPGEALLLSEQRQEKIDLLLTDVVMPEMSGPQLATRLKSSRPEMKVVCMSGYTNDAAIRSGLVESGIAFLQKPITPDSVKRKLRSVLDG